MSVIPFQRNAQIQVCLPRSISDNGIVHPAAENLEKNLFTVCGESELQGTDPSKIIHIHVHNSMTNIRGTDGCWVEAITRSLVADSKGLPERFSLKFTFSSAAERVQNEDLERAAKLAAGHFPSKLPKESFDKDIAHVAAFHNQTDWKAQKPHWLIVSGSEPEDDENPTCLATDRRAQDMSSILKAAELKGIFTLASCRAAHVGLSDLATEVVVHSDRPIINMRKKIKTIATAAIEDPENAMVKGLPSLDLHISRWNTLNEQIISGLTEKGVLTKIASSSEQGVGTILAQNASGNIVYISGHPESTAEDPKKEDDRDVGRNWPGVPHQTANYDPEYKNPKFVQDGARLLGNMLREAFRRKQAGKASNNNEPLPAQSSKFLVTPPFELFR